MANIGAATEVKYRDIARRLIAKESPKNIAIAMGITPGTLYWHMRQPMFRAALHDMDTHVFHEIDHLLGEGGLEVTQQIAGAQDEAFNMIVHLMRYGSKEGVQLNAAKDLLDRGGSTAPRKVAIEAKIELRETSVKFLLHAYKEATQLDEGSNAKSITAECSEAGSQQDS